MREILDVIHKTIYQFFDVCDDDEEVPMSDKDKLLLEVNKAICNNLKALEQETTTKNNLGVDRVARKDVERYIEGFINEYTSREKLEFINLELDGLKHIPSVTPQEPRWIPTSERLPEEDGEYYTTIYDTDEDYLYMDIAELEDGIWQYKDYIKVLAWMPLPKPYEPQESEE